MRHSYEAHLSTPGFEQRLSSRNGPRTIDADSCIPAVVQQQVGASPAASIAADSSLHFLQQALGGRWIPVEDGDVPKYRDQSHFACHAQHGRPPRAMRRTEVLDPLAENVLNGCIGGR